MKEQFVAQLDRAVLTLEGLPVSAAMAQFLSAELKAGDPAWWKIAAKAWEKRKFVAWNEAWSLFLTCVHFEALNDADNPLVPYFPSCRGTDEADPSAALAKFLARAHESKSFFENLKSGHRRSYVDGRAPIWLAPASLFFQKRDMPFYAVEVNAGAGLNLAPDVISPVEGFDSSLISARIGLDPQPLLLADILQRRWLTAAILPDNRPGIVALDKAIASVLKKQAEDAVFIQLVECAPELAPKFVAKNIPADDKDVGLLLLNMATTARMTDAEYESYSKDIAETMAPWGDRALWVEIESVRGEIYSTTYQVRAYRLVNGALRRCVVAAIDLDAKKIDFVKESEAFLSV